MSLTEPHENIRAVFTLSIPRLNDTPLMLSLDIGESAFVLGANGTGKSSLMQSFFSSNPNKAKRISAHRQTWLSSNALTMSPYEKRSTESSMLSNDSSTQARWRDDHAAARVNLAIYDLIDADNVRSRDISSAFDAYDMELASRVRDSTSSPIKLISELMQLSSMPLTISIEKNEEIFASKSKGSKYSIAELSDGERNALLIGASVLTAEPGSLILIDEPERHLHRSIISPLLTQLFAKRSDCAFVISTHDVMLPIDNPSAQSVLVRGCAYEGASVTGWDIDLVSPGTDIDEELKKDILGARRKVIFIEGTEQSLDKPLYSLLFPDVSVIAKSGCQDVENAVSGARGASSLNWVDAYGIVDDDRRTPDEINHLLQKGIYAVSVYSVESLYYHPEVQKHVVERHAKVTGEDALAKLNAAKDAALKAISNHAQRMSERAIEKVLRESLLKKMPGQPEIRAAQPITIHLDIASIVSEEVSRFQRALEDENLIELITKYPIRETSLRDDVARALGFQKMEQYESTVLKLVKDEEEVRNFIRSLFGPLQDDILL